MTRGVPVFLENEGQADPIVPYAPARYLRGLSALPGKLTLALALFPSSMGGEHQKNKMLLDANLQAHKHRSALRIFIYLRIPWVECKP
jgi:hypothetical protein